MLLAFSLLSNAMAADCAETVSVFVSAQRATYSVYTAGRPTEALEEVARAHAGLSCQQTLVRPEDLARLYQVGGVAALRAGDPVEAERWLLEAALRTPEVEFGEDLDANAALVYEQTLKSELPQFASTRARATLWVDGVGHAPGELIVLSATEHLVQVVEVNGEVVSEVIRFSPGTRSEIPEVPLHTISSRRPASQRALGASMVAFGVGSLVGLTLANGKATEQYMNREAGYPQGALVAWGAGSAAVALGGVYVLSF